MSDHGPSLLGRIRRDEELAALMAYFEFDLRGDDHVEQVQLASGARLDPVAGCGAGGTYFLCGDGDGEDRPVLYADSEGSAGLLADDLRGAPTVLLGLRTWPCGRITVPIRGTTIRPSGCASPGWSLTTGGTSGSSTTASCSATPDDSPESPAR